MKQSSKHTIYFMILVKEINFEYSTEKPKKILQKNDDFFNQIYVKIQIQYYCKICHILQQQVLYTTYYIFQLYAAKNEMPFFLDV